MNEKAKAADRPHGAELLNLARRTLIEEILPVLPEERRYSARMMAKAMEIAARELEQVAPPDLSVLETLAEGLRAGRHDGDPAVHAQLLAWAEKRVAVTNPRALK